MLLPASSTRYGSLTVLLFAALAAVADGSPRGGTTPEEEIRELVAALGSDSWFRRENAQDRLLEFGTLAVPFLERAVDSTNIELAYRAGDLLERIDPQVVDFQTLKVRLPDAPGGQATIVSMSSTTASPGEEVLATTNPVAGERTPGALDEIAGRATSYFIRYSAAPGELLDIDISDSAAGERARLSKPLGEPGAVSILKRTDESTFSTKDAELKRERRRYLTFLVTETRRQTTAPTPWPTDPEITYAKLVQRLLVQGQPATSAEKGVRSWRKRAVALEALADLRTPEATETFRLSLDDDLQRSRAAVGLAESELLAEVLDEFAQPRADEDKATRLDDASERIAFKAATRLAELGDARGVRFLINEIVRVDNANLYWVMASLGDYLRRSPPPEALRLELFDAVFREELLSRAVWHDEETLYFLNAVVGLLRPQEDEERALRFQELVEKLATGQLGSATPSFAACLDLWRGAQKKLPHSTTAEAGLVLRLMPGFAEKKLLARAQSEFRRILSRQLELGAITLPDVLEPLRRQLTGENAAVKSDTCSFLLRFLQKETLRPDWLRPATEILVDAVRTLSGTSPPAATRRGRSSLRLSLEHEIYRWTRVRSTPGSKAKAAPGDTWSAWLADAEKVTARQEQIRQERDQKSFLGDPVALFVFLVRTTSPARRKETESPQFTVLDGRHFTVADASPFYYTDPAGVPQRLRLTSRPGNANSDTFRLEIAESTMHMRLDHPTIGNSPRPAFAARIFEHSDQFIGARFLNPGGAYRHNRVLLATRRSADNSMPTADSSKLWAWFQKNRLLAVTPDISTSRANATVKVLDALGLQEALPLLQKLFEEKPTAAHASRLHALGDPRGLEFLQAELKSDTASRRQEAAKILATAGVPEGAVVLLQLLQQEETKKPKRSRGSPYSAFNALDRHLLKNPSSGAREEILDFFLSVVEDPRWQIHVFRTLERVAEVDFGYQSAKGLDDTAQRNAAIAEAVTRARGWWKRERSQPATGKSL